MPSASRSPQAVASSLPAGSRSRRSSGPTRTPALSNAARGDRPFANEFASRKKQPTRTRGRAIRDGSGSRDRDVPLPTRDGGGERLDIRMVGDGQRSAGASVGDDV